MGDFLCKPSWTGFHSTVGEFYFGWCSTVRQEKLILDGFPQYGRAMLILDGVPHYSRETLILDVVPQYCKEMLILDGVPQYRTGMLQASNRVFQIRYVRMHCARGPASQREQEVARKNGNKRLLKEM